MSLLRSQDFLYFQNKAHHYKKLSQAKSTLRIPHNKTIQVVRTNRDMPSNREYQINQQNSGLTKRIVQIATSKRRAVQQAGHYSRYNQYQRPFFERKRQSAASRDVEIQNQILTDKIIRMKARVGSVLDWKKEYEQKEEHRKHMSKYDEGNRSKRDLVIVQEPFLPHSYISYIEGMNKSTLTTNTPHQEHAPPLAHPKVQKFQLHKLFLLPTLTKEEHPPSDNTIHS